MNISPSVDVPSQGLMGTGTASEAGEHGKRTRAEGQRARRVRGLHKSPGRGTTHAKTDDVEAVVGVEGEAERQYLGMINQEPPRTTRRKAIRPSIQALPSTGAPS